MASIALDGGPSRNGARTRDTFAKSNWKELQIEDTLSVKGLSERDTG